MSTSPVFQSTLPAAAQSADRLADLRKRILASHKKCVQAQGDAMAYAIEAGETLLLAKEETAVGMWLCWMKDNFSAKTGLTVRTAQSYMALAERKEDIVAHLDAKRASHRLAGTMATLTIRAALGLLREIDRASGKKPKSSASKSSFTPEDFRPSAAEMHLDADMFVSWPGGESRRVLIQAALDTVEETIDAAVIDYGSGKLELALLLLPLDPTARWFGKIIDQPLAVLKNLVPFPRHADDRLKTTLRPGMLVLLGEPNDEPQFARICQQFGHVLISYRQPLAAE